MISNLYTIWRILPVAVIFLGLILPGRCLAVPILEDIGETLSIDECVKIALKHNPGHQKTQGELDMSSANLLASYGNFLPSVYFNFGLSEDRYFNPTYVTDEGSVRSFPLTVPAGTFVDHDIDSITGLPVHVLNDEYIQGIPQGARRSSNGYLQIRETLFQGGSNIFNLMKSRKEKEAARQNISFSELDLVYQIHQQYYEVLANKKMVELAKEVLEQRKEQFRLAKARHEVGSVTRLDVMQAEIDKGNQENTLLAEENNLKISKMELNQLMGIPLETDYNMADEFTTVEPSFDEHSLVSSAKEGRPDLLWLNTQEEVAVKEVWVQRSSYLPNVTFDLFFFRSEQGTDNDPFTFSPNNEDTRLALNLDWQFFSGFSRHSSNKAARVNLENLRYDVLEKELLIEKEVKEAIMNLESVYQQSLITQKNRQLASENLRLEQERYRLGSSSLLDLRVAQVTYIEAETEHINKVFEFNTSYAALERATGLKLRNL
jgi:outer membrane protein TolC